MVSHAGIPTHMVINPEPNLRPLSIRRDLNCPSDPLSVPHTSDSGHAPPSITRAPDPDTSHVTARVPNTVTVPIRSKQKSPTTDEPLPKPRILTYLGSLWLTLTLHHQPSLPLRLLTIQQLQPQPIRTLLPFQKPIQTLR
jgi:hypothetical protein